VFYKLLGRFFFYFYVLPFFKKVVAPVFRDALIKAVYDNLAGPEEDLSEKLLRDKDNGLTDVQIATKHRISPTKVRHILAEARTASRADNIARAKSLSEAGESVAEIAKRMNLSQTSVMAMLRTDS